jgi:C4-dicarboxylate transporter DctQ subunit
MGISYGVRVGAHIGVDAVVRLLGPAARRAVSIVAVLLCLAYTALVLVGATEYVAKMRMIGVELDDLPIERWQVLAVLPIGYALVAWRFLQVLWGLVSGRSDSLHLADEAAEALRLRSQQEPNA